MSPTMYGNKLRAKMTKPKAESREWDGLARAKRLWREQHAVVCGVQKLTLINCQCLSQAHEIS
jgi:hypothetical protein